MAARKRKDEQKNGSGSGALGFETKLSETAGKLRVHVDGAEYKHFVLGLIFLKYISDAFEERRQFLVSAAADPKTEYFIKEPTQRHGVAEDRDEYVADTRRVRPGSVMFVVRVLSIASESRIGITTREVTFDQDLKAIVPREGVSGQPLAHFLLFRVPAILGLADEASRGTKRVQTELLTSLLLALRSRRHRGGSRASSTRLPRDKWRRCGRASSWR
jgi:hypothetical protein